MLKMAARRASPFSKTSECLRPALASALSCVHASRRGLSDCSRAGVGRARSTSSWRDRPRPPLRRALGKALWPPRKSLKGAHESLASGRLAHHSILQGWPGGPNLDSESLWGLGLRPDPEPRALPSRGGVGTTRKCGKTVKKRKLSLDELDFSHGSRLKY